MLVTDTFTDTTGTLLSAHTADSGDSWSNYGDTPYQLTAQIESNRLRGLGSYYMYVPSSTPTSAEYDVTADIFVASLTGATETGVAGRKVGPGQDTHYQFRYNPGGGAWELYVAVSGSYTLLGSSSATLTALQTYAVKLQIRDAAKKGFVDGVELVSSTDNSLTSTGKPAVVGGSAGASTGLHIDNFAASDPVTDVAPAGTFDPIVVSKAWF